MLQPARAARSWRPVDSRRRLRKYMALGRERSERNSSTNEWNLSSSWRRGPGEMSPSTTTRRPSMPSTTSTAYQGPSTGATGLPLAAWQRSRSQRLEHDVVDDVRAGEGPRRQREEQDDGLCPLFRKEPGDAENQRRRMASFGPGVRRCSGGT